MFAMTLGVFMWSPTLLSAAAAPLTAAMMAVQVRLEEEALTAKHGQAYREYAERVPRWVWPIG
jgi:protein-S-isoprenylcysteine O-methyltransferase Ste14